MTSTEQIGTIDTGYPSRAVVSVTVRLENDRLSIQGEAKRPRASDIDMGGQMIETIAAMTDDELTISRAERNEIVRIWRRWHLNDMRAGCEHQRWMPELGSDVGEVCPVCGYSWGSAWLAEDLPESVRLWAQAFGE